MATCGIVMLRARESNAKTCARFESGLLDNEVIIIKKAAMWHQVTNIIPVNGPSGHRDILIIAFNDWAHRRYGEEFERNLGVTHADVNQ